LEYLSAKSMNVSAVLRGSARATPTPTQAWPRRRRSCPLARKRTRGPC
jgi:hypothetical protein